MRKVLSISILLVLVSSLFAEAPKKIGYQACIRKQNNTLLADKNVGVKISICLDSINGTPVYIETHAARTNGNGLMNLKIGEGTPVLGSFNEIDLSSGNYFIKTETDPDGGTNYTINNSSELMSVPYALHSESSEKCKSFESSVAGHITHGDSTSWSMKQNKLNAGHGINISNDTITLTNNCFTHYIGELFGGGIVVAVWKESGIEHGLVASLTDISTGVQWSSTIPLLVGPMAQSAVDGQTNTTAIVASGDISGAAYLCDNYTSGGFSDWYLPAVYELKQLRYASFYVNTILGASNGFYFDNGIEAYYWSSTEDYRASGGVNAYSVDFGLWQDDSSSKASTYRVRAVRRY